ncbi:alpha/beta fold hydrolase [Catenuloplanes atrovinosus]|uniref:Carboxylesterase n=1 Tax=Catenuloplanes atrovinosus TaxID=137266 RepID=A0AAE3YPM5_9ACTN|nr:alpha/beta fold hydrolase [Catenuloplanes atrovinosus]MDR7277534.1 carboxylesterase [Catenuloplanes atrovinosus]
MNPTVARVLRTAGIAVAALLAVLLVAVAAVFTWPLDADGLHPAGQRLSFAEARARVAEKVAAEEADPGILPECRSMALVHEDRPAARSVLMLHGFTDCPVQFAQLAATFYDQGYNVYVPLAPRHGYPDREALGDLRARDLAEYASAALDVTVALGAEAGVIGLSGGAMLATRLTAERPDDVRRLLSISPFYRPAPAQAAPVTIRPLIVLYGFRLLPDHVDDKNMSYAALAQYVRLAETTDTGRSGGNLASIAVVTAVNDDLIDMERAISVPRAIADARGVPLTVHEFPAESGLGHDPVDPNDVGTARDEVYRLYLALYEDRS